MVLTVFWTIYYTKEFINPTKIFLVKSVLQSKKGEDNIIDNKAIFA